MRPFKEQITRHSVALISLSVALAGLGYNTWRNELTEANRNVRQAGMQTLLLLGELDRVTFFTTFGDEISEDYADRGNTNSGWAYVLTIRDLGTLLPEPAMSACGDLFTDWNNNSGHLRDKSVYETVSASIDNTRSAVLEVLEMLD